MLLEKTNRILYLFSATKRSSLCRVSSLFFCSPVFFVIFPSLSEFMHLNPNFAFLLFLSSDTYISRPAVFLHFYSLFFILSTHTQTYYSFLLSKPYAFIFQISSTPLFPFLQNVSPKIWDRIFLPSSPFPINGIASYLQRLNVRCSGVIATR